MCNWFQNKLPTHTFAMDWDTWHGNWAAPCYFNGALPTGSPLWCHCLQRHQACEGLYWLISPWTKWLPFLQRTLSNEFSWMKMVEFRFELHWNLFPGVQLTVKQHWFGLGAEQATSQYLNQWWPSSLVHICNTRGRWVNSLSPEGCGFDFFNM